MEKAPQSVVAFGEAVRFDHDLVAHHPLRRKPTAVDRGAYVLDDRSRAVRGGRGLQAAAGM
jgi:hypothetical protein